MLIEDGYLSGLIFVVVLSAYVKQVRISFRYLVSTKSSRQIVISELGGRGCVNFSQ